MTFQTLYYTTRINASPETVHHIMLNRETYCDWTRFFSPDSDIRGDWSEGNEMYFISKDAQGAEMGMISVVDKNILGEVVAIRHIGIFGDGEKRYSGAPVDSWKHAYECYRFRPIDDGTELICSVEVTDAQHVQGFNTIWPQALDRLNFLCEQPIDHGQE